MTHTIGIMQPYFFPYLGYFQLISAVDEFVIYDNIKYTKKGWINRNRFILNGQPAYFSIPLQNGSDSLDINQRLISSDYSASRFINQLSEAYRKTPFFEETLPLIESVAHQPQRNLFTFLHAGLLATCQHLLLPTPLLVSSDIELASALKGQARVIGLCQARRATRYINPAGGMDLYDDAHFASHGLTLRWLQAGLPSYAQPRAPAFVPALSILDVLCCAGRNQTRRWIRESYTLLPTQAPAP